MSEQRTALVLGATGGVGGAIAAALAGRGWAIRALYRNPARLATARKGVARHYDWRHGDAMSAGDVAAAAAGAELIVHAVNPPGYRNWGRLVLPMLENSIRAATGTGARILLPGTVYNYGPDVLPAPTEESPQNPVTRKGRIRAAMEARLAAASADGAITALVLRAGDYFGPGAGSSWFSQAMVRPGRPLRRVVQPGCEGIGHQGPFRPDVAETPARLLDLPDGLPRFARYHMHGHWDSDGRQMVEAVRRAAAQPDLPVRCLPWRAIALAAPLVPLARELNEVRYLWERPVRLNNTRLVCTLGGEPHTPLDEAVGSTLAALGCLPAVQDIAVGGAHRLTAATAP